MVEVESGAGWVVLDPRAEPPRIGESALFRIRGVAPDAIVEIGGVRVPVGTGGIAELKLIRSDDLRGHVGLIDVVVDGRWAGEIEVLPDKMSDAAFRLLRQELEALWIGLIWDDGGTARVRASGPPAEDLWGRLGPAVDEIRREPRSVIVQVDAVRRMERVRRASSLSATLVRSYHLGRPGRTRVAGRSTAVADNAMVAEALRRMASYARREPDGSDIARRATAALRDPLFASAGPAPSGVPWGARSDPRYRKVQGVLRELMRPEARPTEGPGDLRLGVRALTRLYEYWVYLQVLHQAKALYGNPVGAGFSVLGAVNDRGITRLELPQGTTVEFPGGVMVAFEPRITARGDEWMGIKLVPNPVEGRAHQLATPDVVVLRSGEQPWATVIDAKYVARRFVPMEATKIHDKYARMLLDGEPVVRHVIAAHPHAEASALWAGYGYVPMRPGGPIGTLPLPRPLRSQPARAVSSSAERSSQAVAGKSGPEPATARPTVVIADQRWMARRLGDARIDLRALIERAAGGFVAAHMVVPPIERLDGFTAAAEARGWVVHRSRTESNGDYLHALEALMENLRRDDVIAVVVTADEHVREVARQYFGGAVSFYEAVHEVRSV